MAKKEPSQDKAGPEEVRVTIVVEPGRVRAALTKLLAGRRVHIALACAGLIAAGAAGAIIVGSSRTGRGTRSSGTYSSRPTASSELATQFGLRFNCARLTVVLPDGAYARIDLDHAGPCGTFGNQVTLVLHRIKGRWVRVFEASSWTCPMRQLPRLVMTELRLCGRTVLPSRPVARSPRGVL